MEDGTAPLLVLLAYLSRSSFIEYLEICSIYSFLFLLVCCVVFLKDPSQVALRKTAIFWNDVVCLFILKYSSWFLFFFCFILLLQNKQKKLHDSTLKDTGVVRLFSQEVLWLCYCSFCGVFWLFQLCYLIYFFSPKSWFVWWTGCCWLNSYLFSVFFVFQAVARP